VERARDDLAVEPRLVVEVVVDERLLHVRCARDLREARAVEALRRKLRLSREQDALLRRLRSRRAGARLARLGRGDHHALASQLSYSMMSSSSNALRTYGVSSPRRFTFGTILLKTSLRKICIDTDFSAASSHSFCGSPMRSNTSWPRKR